MRFFTQPIAISALIGTSTVSLSNASDSPSRTACRILRHELPNITHFPGTSEYSKDVWHYEQVSGQNSTCSAAPSTVEDVQKIIRLIGRPDIRSPFAIKSGGHSFNPSFSSTPGVQISLHNFKDLTYNPTSQIVRLGTGWTWDGIYTKLQAHNVTVVGGRIPGVGMGLLFGGGYSWLTNQHGIASDNVVSFELVLPNGTFVEVTQRSQPDLFFGLKGGLNNFGIVTGVTLKTYPTGDIWAGTISYSINYNDQVMQAVEDFSINNTDEKAQLEAVYAVTSNDTFWQILFFYDGNDPVPFRSFLDIPSTSKKVGITTHSKFVEASAFPPGIGAFLHTVPMLKYTVPILKSVQSSILTAHSSMVSFNRSVGTLYWFAEPFHNHFTHDTSGPSAYPHLPSRPITPSCFWFDYTNPDDVEYFREKIKEVADEVEQVAIREGQSKKGDIKYPNYAVSGTPVEEMYGENLERLRRIRRGVDPRGVMQLQGGFLF